MSDLRQYAPATERNRQPILEVHSQFLPKTGNILEISSGTGEHAVFLPLVLLLVVGFPPIVTLWL